MANEEMKKTMQFILDQQAKVTVKLEIMSDKVERLTEDVTMLKEVTLIHSQTLDRAVLVLDRLIKAQGRTDQKIAALAERTDKKLAALAARTDQKFAELAENQKRTDQKLAKTDERLASFIATVERYIRKSRNGKP